jgi:NADPH:quinone reductase
MQAILMTATGGPEVLHLHAMPNPVPQHRELLVRLQAAGVNPIDTKLRQRGTFFDNRLPAMLGCDGAGIVEAVGAGVRRFQVGDAVYFCNGGLGGHPGTYAEYATVDERFAALKPARLSFVEAAAVPLVLITAWEALCDRARLPISAMSVDSMSVDSTPASQRQTHPTVLVQAGAGGVGHMAIQLAKCCGAKVAATVSTAAKAEFVLGLGCDRAIVYPENQVVAEVLDWTAGQGVDIAFDTVGGPVLEQCFPAVRLYGDVVTILEPAATTNWKVARTRNQRISLELMLTPMLQDAVAEQQAQAAILERCAPWFDQGKLQVQVSHALPLAQAEAAHRLLEAGSMTGKVVLIMP